MIFLIFMDLLKVDILDLLNIQGSFVGHILDLLIFKNLFKVGILNLLNIHGYSDP